MLTTELQALIPRLTEIAAGAGEKICGVYAKDFAVEYKDDKSPVTEADLQSHRHIVAELERLEPRLPILSEENSDIPFTERKSWQSYWLIDPLDGTREFINRRDDFTINIALVHKHQSVLGIVYMPTTRECYTAVSGNGAYKLLGDGAPEKLAVRNQAPDEIVVAVSYSHAGGKTQEFLNSLTSYSLTRRGSMVKCCLIAEGKADIYPRLGNTCEWDTAAGQCVLEESGGCLTDWQGRPLRYNTKDSIINPPFVAYAPSAQNIVDQIVSPS